MYRGNRGNTVTKLRPISKNKFPIFLFNISYSFEHLIFKKEKKKNL